MILKTETMEYERALAETNPVITVLSHTHLGRRILLEPYCGTYQRHTVVIGYYLTCQVLGIAWYQYKK